MHKVAAPLRRLQELFWVLPATTILAAVVFGLAVPRIDQAITLPGWLAGGGEIETARTVLTVVVTLGVSVAGVSFSVIVVALVLASQQLSPRVLSGFQREPINQAVLALLLGTSTYALFVLGSIDEGAPDPVPETAVAIAMWLATASLGLFVVFLHHAVRSLNASAVIRRIAAAGHEAVRAPYPSNVGRGAHGYTDVLRACRQRQAESSALEVRSSRAGYVVSIDGDRLIDWAQAHDVMVEQRKPVGAFALTGSVLATVHSDRADLDVDEIEPAFVLQEERVVDGDIGFPIRQLTDIALKGLSPGINDPATAENAMDSVADTLVLFARRPALDRIRVDDSGVPRLVAIVPTLDDLIRLGFDEVRRDAAGRPSFAVRLLELLCELREAVPDSQPCAEISRQAELIAEQASALAEHDADRRLLLAAHSRLHGGQGPVREESGVAGDRE
jgi:uncharacterized membrane protein